MSIAEPQRPKSEQPALPTTTTQRRRLARWRLVKSAVPAVFLLLALVVVGAGWRYWKPGGPTQDLPLMARATRSTLRVIVTERGNLESSKTVDGICELQGYQNKIIFLVPEGAEVKQGDVVVRFDSAEIDRNIAQQQVKVRQAEGKAETTRQEVEVQRNEGDSKITEADLELKLSLLDVEKYEKGDYQVELSGLKGEIALDRADLEQAQEQLSHLQKLVKRGFRSPEQLRRQEQLVARYENYLKRDQGKLQVLEQFDFKRKMTELRSKAEQASKKLERAKASAKAQLAKAQGEHEAARSTLALEQQELKKMLEQKENCTIKAKQSGMVAYANEYWYDSSRQIREGATVYSRQRIFSLPDMAAMQVKVNVHESVVKKVKAGQKAQLRVDAFPNIAIEGTVKSVAPLADSERSWARGGVKEYTTIVTIDRLPDVELKPGMTAEVKILVNELADVLVVPVQAVTEHEHQHYAYVRSGAGFERRQVKVGENNEKLVQILEGLSEQDEIALDARSRGIADFEGDSAGAKATTQTKEDPQPSAKPPVTAQR
jgi:RND family efflux transporter MFP subunit